MEYEEKGQGENVPESKPESLESRLLELENLLYHYGNHDHYCSLKKIHLFPASQECDCGWAEIKQSLWERRRKR